MYSCELDKSLSHKVTRDTLLLGDGSWNKNVLLDSKMFEVCLSKIVGNAILQSDLAFRSREKAGAAEKEEYKKKNVVDEKTEAMMAV